MKVRGFAWALAVSAGISSCSGCPPNNGTSAMIHATTGWQIYPDDGNYHYGPSIIMESANNIHMWTCSKSTGIGWDVLRYRHSVDGGRSWTADVIALAPSANSLDQLSTCDPGVIKIGNYFYIGYTSTTNDKGTQNSVFVARSLYPNGPFDKWNGSSWGGNPQPIRTYPGDPSYYGYGEPSFVLLGKKLFVYYSDDQAVQFTNIATVDDATVSDWPAHLVDRGHAIARTRPDQDSADVKYVDSLSSFVAVTTADRFSPNATVAAYQSKDGLTFVPIPYLGARLQVDAHNIGMSGDASGHLSVFVPNFVAYGYSPHGPGTGSSVPPGCGVNAWGCWPTFLDPITFGSAPLATPVGGEVSSIFDWNWSGPKAWDGDSTTVFSSASHATCTAEEWAYVDIGASRSITGITLVPRPQGYGFPIDFTIGTSSDRASWTTVPGQNHSGFANPGSAPVTLTFGAAVTAQYIRIDATMLGKDDLGGCFLQMAEIEPIITP